MTEDINAIDTSRIDSTRVTDEMWGTIDGAQSLLREYIDDHDGQVPNAMSGGPKVREDCWFGVDEEDVLFDAWQMLRYGGLSESDVETLTRAIEAGTIYSRSDLTDYYAHHVAE